MREKRPTTERSLKPEERALIVLLSSTPKGRGFISHLDQLRVIDMDDGGMGRLQFGADRHKRVRQNSLAEAQYEDEDGVLVWVELNLDQHGELFELDSWKVDFEPLIRIAPVDQVWLLPVPD